MSHQESGNYTAQLTLTAESFQSLNDDLRAAHGMDWAELSDIDPEASLSVVAAVFEHLEFPFDTTIRPIDVVIAIGHSSCTHPNARFRGSIQDTPVVCFTIGCPD